MRRAEEVVSVVSRLMPLNPPAALTDFFGPRLEAARLFVSPAVFARFFLATLVLPIAGETAAAIAHPQSEWLAVLAPMALVQASPFIVLASRTWRRRRAVESELPYVAMLFHIMSYRSNSSLPDALKEVEGLGPGVFPAFSAEAQGVLRNITYGSDGDLTGVERSFERHPSRKLREFVHGYSTALVTGRDVADFVGSETERLLDNQIESWRTYSSLLSSMTEVAFIFLAVFPVGVQMIAGSTLALSSSQLLTFSALLLALVTICLLLWMDLNQPLSNNTSCPARLAVIATASFLALMLLYQWDVLNSVMAAAAGLAISSGCAIAAHGHYSRVTDGEKLVATVLHDLAELAQAGVELPSALTRLASEGARYGSVKEPLIAFARMLSLGRAPQSAQRSVSHPAWMVRLSFALLGVTLETGGGYEQLDRLSQSFRKMSDAKGNARSSVLPFACLGVIVPAISAASAWLLKSMQSLGPGLAFFSIQTGVAGIGGSIVATSFLAGLVVSKAYSQSVRSMVGVPPLMCSALISFLVFGGS